MDAILELFSSFLGDMDYAQIIETIKSVVTYLVSLLSSAN